MKDNILNNKEELLKEVEKLVDLKIGIDDLMVQANEDIKKCDEIINS